MKIPMVVVLLLVMTVALSGCGSGAAEHYVAGVEHSEEARWQEALAEFDEAIRLDSDHAEAHYQRALAYGALEQHERAIQDYDEAIRLDSDHEEAYSGRALTLLLSGTSWGLDLL